MRLKGGEVACARGSRLHLSGRIVYAWHGRYGVDRCFEVVFGWFISVCLVLELDGRYHLAIWHGMCSLSEPILACENLVNRGLDCFNPWQSRRVCYSTAKRRSRVSIAKHRILNSRSVLNNKACPVRANNVAASLRQVIPRSFQVVNI